jgi:hypothetical protein
MRPRWIDGPRHEMSTKSLVAQDRSRGCPLDWRSHPKSVAEVLVQRWKSFNVGLIARSQSFFTYIYGNQSNCDRLARCGAAVCIRFVESEIPVATVETPPSQPRRVSLPPASVWLSLAVVLALFGSAIYVLGFYLR